MPQPYENQEKLLIVTVSNTSNTCYQCYYLLLITFLNYYILQTTNYHLCTIFKNTKENPLATIAQHVKPITASPFIWMATLTNPFIAPLAFATVKPNVDIITPQNNILLIIRFFLLPFGEAGWGHVLQIV